MGLWLAILRFFGLAEPTAEDIIEYPVQKESPSASREPQLVDYRKELPTLPPEMRIAVLRPELSRHGQVTYSLSVYTQNLREGYILLVDVGRIVNQNREEARRVVSFLSGVVEAIKGKRRVIGPNLYLFAPSNVQISGDLPRGDES
ncbi:MAG: hypothetical protein A2Y63_06425 [Candidatus Riflebacteria bacterium RBG_13_59_9]|nr:MAG: hypothetical protein A2Y63_06425 [Candidatus Riflebacteria bacterium RBG_13_59_9]